MNTSFVFAFTTLLALSGIAAAQSTVTIYGVVDMGITKANAGTSNAANTGQGAVNQWGVQQGQASRIGFRGREDLGGGLYARFSIEHRFSPDTGTSTFPTFWMGNSEVAVGNPTYGEIWLGRNYTPVTYVAINADPTYWNYVSQFGGTYTYANFNASATNKGGTLTSMDGSSIRHSNTVGYKSPSFGGLTGEFTASAGEGNRKAAYGLNLQYRNGPIYAGFGLDGWDSDNRFYLVAAGYDFGIVRPVVSFGNAKGGASPTYAARTATFGLSGPLGGGRLYGGVGRLDPSGTDNNSTKLLAGYEYLLSKRTTLYTNVGSAKTDRLTRATAFDLGVNHRF